MELNTPFNFLEYNSIVNSVKTYIKEYSNSLHFKDVQSIPSLKKIVMQENGSSHIYQGMITIEQEKNLIQFIVKYYRNYKKRLGRLL